MKKITLPIIVLLILIIGFSIYKAKRTTDLPKEDEKVVLQPKEPLKPKQPNSSDNGINYYLLELEVFNDKSNEVDKKENLLEKPIEMKFKREADYKAVINNMTISISEIEPNDSLTNPFKVKSNTYFTIERTSRIEELGREFKNKKFEFQGIVSFIDSKTKQNAEKEIVKLIETFSMQAIEINMHGGTFNYSTKTNTPSASVDL